MRLVMAHTSLEENFPINMVVIGLDGKPQRKNLRQMLVEWVNFRIATVTRRIKFRLGQVDRRIHILQGRHIAYLNIDKVIKVIRNADEPKPALIKAFKLTEVQADDILEIRLRQLARLEGIKIEQELKALKLERKDLQAVLGDERLLKKQVVNEIRADARTYGDARRTLIEESGRAVAERQVVDEPLTLIVSRNGWVRSRQGHGLDLSALSYKDGDGAYGLFETRSVHPIAMIDSSGRCFGITAGEIPGGRGDGVPLTSLVELTPGARVAQVVDAQPGQRYLVANSGGYGFIVKSEDLLTRIRAGKAFMTIQEGESVLRPAAVTKEAAYAVSLSEKGRMLLFPVDELKEIARGRGVVMMGLDKDEKMVAVGFADAKAVTVTGLSRSGKERSITVSGTDLQKHILHRARKGCLVPGKLVPTGVRTG
jgi:topoisomerase-4 subunit A